jgi:hypothetical protein
VESQPSVATEITVERELEELGRSELANKHTDTQQQEQRPYENSEKNQPVNERSAKAKPIDPRDREIGDTIRTAVDFLESLIEYSELSQEDKKAYRQSCDPKKGLHLVIKLLGNTLPELFNNETTTLESLKRSKHSMTLILRSLDQARSQKRKRSVSSVSGNGLFSKSSSSLEYEGQVSHPNDDEAQSSKRAKKMTANDCSNSRVIGMEQMDAAVFNSTGTEEQNDEEMEAADDPTSARKEKESGPG